MMITGGSSVDIVVEKAVIGHICIRSDHISYFLQTDHFQDEQHTPGICQQLRDVLVFQHVYTHVNPVSTLQSSPIFVLTR